jgi:hypothetical protein
MDMSMDITSVNIDWSLVTGVLAGVGLAAAAGFRVFVPLLVLALANKAGVMGVAPGFDWLGSTPAVTALSCAAVLEIVAYYVPWLDHALDTLAAPAAVVAGSLVVASQVTGMDPWLGWVTGIVAGGGAAGLVQASTMLLRGVSLVTTGGLANPLVATLENGLAILVAALAVLVPLLALLAVALALFILLRRRQRVVARRVAGRRVAA